MRIKRLGNYPKHAPLPARHSEFAAGLDMLAAIHDPIHIAPGRRAIVPLGVALEIPPLHVGLLLPRSGLAFKHGVSGHLGVIDSDYRGEVKALLFNTSHDSFTVNPLERVCQLVITPIATPIIEEVDALSDTARGAGGFGHTGR